MADDDTGGPRLPNDVMTAALAQLNRFWRSHMHDAYRLGFQNGEDTAVARILKAAQPGAVKSHAARAERNTRVDVASDGPGARTHRLIESVLGSIAGGKATPTVIAASTMNRQGIKRDAVRNALRRGKASGRYVSDGNGQYALGRATAQK
jgi:hypothetical protein